VLPLLIIGLPIIDTGIVIWERMRDGRSPFRADKNHVHHKLLKMGLFHTEAVFIIYLTQFMLVSSAYFFRFNSEVYILTFYVVFAGIVVSFFHLSGKYNLTLKRSGFFDTVIKRKLRILKDKESLLRASSFILYSILPVLLITHCALSDGLPRYSSLVSFTAALLMLCFWITGSRMLGGMVRAVLYLMIPAVIYFSQEALPCFPGLNLRPIYLGFFVLCLFSAIMVVRLNRGTNTFHANPMDFLTLIVSLCVLPLLGSFMDAREARVYLVQVIILFYSYEILLNEHRWGITTVTATTIGALLIIALKGVLV
jgi:UDP-GlcNAc:undecaprenyl-phosphate GlcNAc-1-phosphate transferase